MYRRIVRWVGVGVLMILAIALGVTIRQGANGLAQGKTLLPDDPLSVEEMQQAEAITRADAQGKTWLDGARAQLVYIERQDVDKDASEAKQLQRAATVVFYVYTSPQGTDTTVTAQVDLGTGQVTQLTTRTGFQPPITLAEMDTARKLALADDRVTQAATARKIEARQVQATGLVYHASDYHDVACQMNRCVELTLDTPQGSRTPLTVVVNLSAQRVERLLAR